LVVLSQNDYEKIHELSYQLQQEEVAPNSQAEIAKLKEEVVVILSKIEKKMAEESFEIVNFSDGIKVEDLLVKDTDGEKKIGKFVEDKFDAKLQLPDYRRMRSRRFRIWPGRQIWLPL